MEWEKAARGADGRLYPWGNCFERGCCNSRESGARAGLSVGQCRAGESPYGCLDMAGNVWEWTQDRERPGWPTRVIRGGSVACSPDQLLACRRQGAPPAGSDSGALMWLGFRCVKPLEPEPPPRDVLEELSSRDDLDQAALSYWNQGRYDRVRLCADRLLRNPFSVPGHYWVAWSLAAERKYAEAITALRPALCRSSFFREAKNLLRELVWRAEEAGEVVPGWREHLKAPELFKQAQEALNKGSLPKARAALEAILKLDPDNAVAHEWMAEVWVLGNQPKKAVSHCQRCVTVYRAELKEDPDNAELHCRFANFLYIQKLHLEEARALAERAVKLEPEDPTYHSVHASVLLELKRYPEAVRALERALELAPTNADYRARLDRLTRTPPRR
jgi:tetratricopeptide (TPR) repeat protein